MQRPFIIALDLDNKEKRLELLTQFKNESLFVKVGMELFYREGRQVIEELKAEGHQIFLDLKLHDIPNTVGRSMKELASLNIDIVNVHAAGGKRMMTAAREGLEQGTAAGQKRPLLIAVTQLTSTDEETMRSELLIERPLNEVVQSYASFALDSGVDGVVCSAKEVPLIHEACGTHFYTVCPGIRRPEDEVGDQKRIVTPGQARELGCYGIVVGRSITNADQPVEVYQAMKQEWEGLK
ncbi:orotidine-5'-phosphate decarboxylase [Halalkalibacter akibai]|uniref:Orotidine 5'-phosphate decarboxylase n=1 Tax=Halalkalibacter akibai (strain ATCC 43226 / DSM 21942 / CIP 109018 / JCM 9157 / 1139) TaxID=1236973 RepID=W4QPP8_HALA3|nr:orotidine-5'-phosphate decarboxylase [Halalkalibacter akibai]GAE33887.1 orotidine 5'-phosphate decarboxylase [Halalkalibacter akibai JCM 9157]